MAYINGKKILDIVMTGLGLPFFSDKGKRAAGLFQGLSDLKKVPEGLEFLQPISCENMFKDCTNLEEAPIFDTSQSTNFHGMFESTRKIKTTPDYDTSNGTDFSMMFRRSTIEVSPNIDTSKGLNFYGMFATATRLKALPELDTHKGRNLGYMFNYCESLQNEKDITYDVEECQKFSFMFNECKKMKVAPIMNTYHGKAFSYMFCNCSSLVTIPKLHLSQTVEMYYDENNMTTYDCFYRTFTGCINLENITIQGWIYHNINFKDCTKLTHDSLMSILTALNNFSSSSIRRSCGLGSVNLAKLTDEEKAIATSKGWNLY